MTRTLRKPGRASSTQLARLRAAVYQRDVGCVICGRRDRRSLQHRRTRGMGGSRLADTPQNLIVVCGMTNTRFESDLQQMALANGWKLPQWSSPPEETPVWYAAELSWMLLDAEGLSCITTLEAHERLCSLYGEDALAGHFQTAWRCPS